MNGASIRPAGFVSRLVAFLVDVALAAGIIAATVWFVTTIDSVLRPTRSQLASGRGSWVVVGISAGIALVYFLGSWSVFGRTPGKAVMGLRIVRGDGRKPGVLRSAVRLFGYFVSAAIFYVGFAWVLVDGSRRGWHDYLAGTSVVYVPREETVEFRGGPAAGAPAVSEASGGATAR